MNNLEIVEELTDIKKSLDVIMLAIKEYADDELGASIVDTLYLNIEKLVYCNLKLINFWTNRNSKLTSFFIMLLYGFYNQKEAKKGDENHYAKV